MSAYMQQTRALEVRTPLGDNQLLLQGFHGREAISSLFEFDLDMRSSNHNIPFDALVGKRVTVAVVLGDGSERYINGVVRNMSQSGESSRLSRYQASVVPWLWLLTRTTNCRIFQQKTAPEIISAIFKERGFTDFSLRLHGSFERRDYCVQYRESDFHFVSRLMEDEGICYFFEHTADKHMLVLTNSPSEFKPCPHQPKARIDYTQGGYLEGEDVLSTWSHGQQVRSGKYESRDFNFEQPSLNLAASTTGRDERQLEVYDYPGEYVTRDRGEARAGLRIQEQDAGVATAAGSSTCRAFLPGYRFDLEGHTRRDQNRSYVLLAVQHRADLGSNYDTGADAGDDGFQYRNTFECIPHGTAYRPPRTTLAPVIEGAQTAIVTGPAGEEIYTDKYGRVKVQFHWDREGKYDQNSSCWVRVSQPWAGKNWGAICLPRVGQEVIVDFLEGNPDRPLITGRVYNAEQMPPYQLPGEMTKSTMKSLSSKGGGGFNELRFEDRKGAEQVFIHAERDQDIRVKNDLKEWIGRDTHLIVKRDQIEEVRGEQHLTVTGDQNEKIGGTVSLTAGADIQEKAGARYALAAGSEIHLKAGANLVLEAGASVTIKAGGAFITLGPTGVSINGAMVRINSGGAAGGGAGSSPAAPNAPLEADKDTPGKVSLMPPKPTSYSPQALALKGAARTGTPFCEVCPQ